MEAFIGVPKEFLLQRYIERQGEFGHVARVVSTTRYPERSFNAITENVYTLHRLLDVIDHYRRGALRSLVIIEISNLRHRLIGLLERANLPSNITVYLWVPSPGSTSETVQLLLGETELRLLLRRVYYSNADLSTSTFFGMPGLCRRSLGLSRAETYSLECSSASSSTYYCCSLSGQAQAQAQAQAAQNLAAATEEVRLPEPVHRQSIKPYRTLIRI